VKCCGTVVLVIPDDLRGLRPALLLVGWTAGLRCS
jgi:hypothetical protein